VPARGRPTKASDNRLLLELLLHEDDIVTTKDIQQHIDLTPQQIRNRMKELDAAGLITLKSGGSQNFYLLTEFGKSELAEELRERLS